MKTETYEALLRGSRADPGAAAQRERAIRLADAARNLESLGRLTEAEEKRAIEAQPQPPPEKPRATAPLLAAAAGLTFH